MKNLFHVCYVAPDGALFVTDAVVVCDPARVGRPLVSRLSRILGFTSVYGAAFSVPPGSRIELRPDRHAPAAYSFLFV